MIKYRPDIDGLRGVAVLLVLLFHAGLPYITGGFVGVDIFFVISGYLITAIIVKDVNSNQFSFVNFYERRIRRILPAFYVVALFTLIGGWIILLPADFLNASKSLLAALFFSGNIYFWRTTDYFSDSSDYQPFLHTWSLGVEEQFYFFFPVLLLYCLHHRRLLTTILALTFSASLILSVYATEAMPWAAYYLLPTRAWQLMAGAVIALYTIRLPENKPLIGVLSLFALMLIFAPAFIYTKLTPFPGIAAIAPTLGAVLAILIGSQSQSLIHKILANKLLVAIGLISYSLYLWHWPIFAFIRNYHADVHLDWQSSILGILLSFICAYLSWRFVERPFRNKTQFNRMKMFAVAGVSSLGVLALGAVIVLNQGLPHRFDQRIVQLYEMTAKEMLRDRCLNLTPEQIKQNQVCLLNENSQSKPVFALWGDSHAASIRNAMGSYATQHNMQGVFLGHVGCGPYPGVINTNFFLSEECYRHHLAAFEYIKNQKTINTVVIHSRWALSIEGTDYQNGSGPDYQLVDRINPNNKGNNFQIVKIAFERTLKELKNAGKSVVIIGPVPEVGYSVPRFLANAIQWNKTVELRPTFTDFMQRQARTFSILDSLKENYIEAIIYPHQRLCDNHFCEVVLEDEPLYFDSNHLTEKGAKLITKTLDVSLF